MSNIYLPKSTISESRANFIWISLLLGFIVLFFAGFTRVFLLQEDLNEYFSRQHYDSSEIKAHRGSIWGKGGAALAMNADTYHITLSPKQLRQAKTSKEQYQRYAQVLAQALEMTPEEVLKQMHSERRFLYLQKNVPASVAEHIKWSKITGVGAEYISKRFYPDGENFAHIVGYTDWRGIGRSGIEFVKHGKLDATDGEVRHINAGQKGAISELSHQPAVAGKNVYLTLDRGLQYQTHTALAAATQKHKAASASAMVMDITNGDILALANYPSFNPNFIRTVEDNQINHALADQVEPGSTVKPFVIALALEDQLTEATEVLETKKALQVGKLRVHDKHVRENLDVRGVIRKSSNVGAVLLAQRIGGERLESFYRQLGFGGDKVLQFPGEGKGLLRQHKGWRSVDLATHAYGYGFSLTLPQLLQAYSIFATDGVLVTPRLWQREAVVAKKHVLSPAVARSVRSMMEEVVSAKGTAAAAAIPGYRVAGKTGTVGKWTNGEFDLSRRRVFFAGMAPASKPRYVVVVMVDEPTKNGDSGGAVAAPLFQKIMQSALLFGGIRPDAIRAKKVI